MTCHTTPPIRHAAGHTLLELLGVLAIMGMLALAGVGVFRLGAVAAMGSEAMAHRLAKDLNAARSRAISTGKDHIVRFSTSGGVTSYQILEEQTDLSTVNVDATREVPATVTVVNSHADLEFAFDGTAAASYSVTFSGGSRTFRCSVWSATGAVAVSED